MIKKLLIIFLTLLFVIVLVKPTNVIADSDSYGFSWSDIKSKAQDFENGGVQKQFDVGAIVSNIANILTTIGVVVILAGLLIIGIKYMIASPDEAAKIKTKLVGLAVSGIVILGAFGIWVFTKNTLATITETTISGGSKTTDSSSKTTIIETPKPTATTAPIATPEPTPAEEDQSGMTFDESIGKNGSWVYVPNIEDVKTYKNIPLVIYYHGTPETWSQNGMVNEKDSLPWALYNGSLKINAIVVSPCFTINGLQASEITETISKIKSKYDINENKIIITGHSGGATTAIRAAHTMPGTFSACIAVSAGYSGIHNLIPSIDCAVQCIQESSFGNSSALEKEDGYVKTTIEKLNSEGRSNVIYTKVPNSTHGTVQQYYQQASLWEWALSF